MLFRSNGIPILDPGSNLTTRVAGLPGGNAHWVKSFGGSTEDLIEMDYDAYLTGISDGEALVGLRKPQGLGVGECNGINNCGIFVGLQPSGAPGSNWGVDWRGIPGGTRQPILKPDLTEFAGGIGQNLTVQTDISKIGRASCRERV